MITTAYIARLQNKVRHISHNSSNWLITKSGYYKPISWGWLQLYRQLEQRSLSGSVRTRSCGIAKCESNIWHLYLIIFVSPPILWHIPNAAGIYSQHFRATTGHPYWYRYEHNAHGAHSVVVLRVDVDLWSLAQYRATLEMLYNNRCTVYPWSAQPFYKGVRKGVVTDMSRSEIYGLASHTIRVILIRVSELGHELCWSLDAVRKQMLDDDSSTGQRLYSGGENWMGVQTLRGWRGHLWWTTLLWTGRTYIMRYRRRDMYVDSNCTGWAGALRPAQSFS